MKNRTFSIWLDYNDTFRASFDLADVNMDAAAFGGYRNPGRRYDTVEAFELGPTRVLFVGVRG